MPRTDPVDWHSSQIRTRVSFIADGSRVAISRMVSGDGDHVMRMERGGPNDLTIDIIHPTVHS